MQKIFRKVVENSGQLTATTSKNITKLSFVKPIHRSIVGLFC